MLIKRSVQFKLEQRCKDGILITQNVPIRLRVCYEGKRIDFSTGFRIDAAKWNNVQQRVKKGCSNKQNWAYNEINAVLSNYETIVHDIFKEYECKLKIPSVNDVKREFSARTTRHDVEQEAKNGSKLKIFFDVYDEFVSIVGIQNSWSKTPYIKYKWLKAVLTEFNNDITFDYLDDNGLTKFIEFLINTRHLHNDTIKKTIVFLKTFLRWSYDKGYSTNNIFTTYKFRLKIIPRKVIYLDSDELKRIINLDIPEEKNYLRHVRDVFVFMCFTGLRYSDALNLRRSDIKGNKIEITTIKTNDSLIIELNKHSKAILDKYKDISFKDNKALPVISGQRMNDYLKDLAKMAHINEAVRMVHYEGMNRIERVYPKYELITSHVARRTFVCRALAIGIPPNIIMKWTGHSDYKAMTPYIAIADNTKAAAMKKFDQEDDL
jgi:integrase